MFTQKLKLAQDLHKELTGETVTDACVAAVLFPKMQIKTQRARMSQIKVKGLNLKESHLRALLECFPYSSAEYWLGLENTTYQKQTFLNKYSIDEIGMNKELQLLWVLLNMNIDVKKLSKKYL